MMNEYLRSGKRCQSADGKVRGDSIALPELKGREL